ncbi:hypothetical protein RGCCGE502_16255 [Rhizobium grahamii CCGE 502]|uniref:Uncharacterized protein n=1 Tax=Rhizobium grahamii CCGE 502 TaxID=990285 RepID=S3HE93_9HYPH|nr:hypothetical protein RGCCGE502_16255 [Rhizobium grahamii CCGE 502]
MSPAAMPQSRLCWFAALVSLIFLVIHLGTRGDLDAIEHALRRDEQSLFAGPHGFLNADTRKPFFLRLRILFPMAYLIHLPSKDLELPRLTTACQCFTGLLIEASKRQGGHLSNEGELLR